MVHYNTGGPRFTVILLGIFALLLSSMAAAAARAEPGAPRVAASIKPLQSLAAQVMQGVGTPEVIVHGAGSPHTYAMRPSEERELTRADVVFWIGPAFERFLVKPVAGLAARTVAMLDAPGVTVLAARRGGMWDSAGHEEDVHLDSATDADPHLFLDPRNAQAIVRAMAATLRDADPAHAAAYGANADAAVARLQALDRELAAELAPVQKIPYVVFHDGYQYLERRYGLNAVGAVVVSPERPPGARRLAEIRDKIQSLHAACVFAEPQFDSALVRTVAEGTARVGVLDALGSDLKPGPDAYGEMMRGLGRALVSCLRG